MVDQQNSAKSGEKEGQEVRKKVKKSRFHFYRFFAGTFSLIIVILIAAAVWMQMSTGYFTTLVYHNSLQMKVTALQKLVAAQESLIAKNQSNIAQFMQSQKTIRASQAFIEAENLIQLANLNLMIIHNIPATVHLLQMAYSHLNQVDSQMAVEIQKIITQNITQLNAIQKVDVTTIYLELQALSNQMAALPLMKEDAGPKIVKRKITKQPQSIWLRGWQTSIETIKDLVIVRHRTKTLHPLITRNQQQLLVLNLHMLFSQAQWGLLNYNEKVYLSSLQQIKSIIDQYYLQTDVATTKMINQLKNLIQINIEPGLPDIGKALAIIKTVNNARLKSPASTTQWGQ